MTAYANSRRTSGAPVRPRALGLTLIEVLIALVVLAVGFLALAGLQSISVANNHSAYLRSQAVIQAHDMADRMYANWGAVTAGAYNSITTTPSSPPTCLTTLGPSSPDALASVNCTTAQMAQFDAHEWRTRNAGVLPSGQGTVVGPDGNGTYTITITWLELEARGAPTKTFTFRVKPLP